MAIVVPIVSEWNPQGIDRSVADIQKAEGGWAKAGVAIEKATLPAGIALGALTAAGWKSIKAAEEAAVANQRLSKVFDSMGYSENAQAAIDYADALELSTGIEAEAIKAAQAKLATFSEIAKSTDTMGRATKVAADLSAAGFGSMESASVMLGKAIQDPIKGMSAMSRVGVTFTKQQEKQITALTEAGKAAEAQGIIFDALENQVGGVAEATATDTAKLANAFGAISDSVGAALLPAFQKLTPYLQKFASWAEQNGALLATIGGIIATLAAGILVLSAAMKTLAIIQSVIALVKGLNLALLSSPWFWVIAAVILLAVIIWKNWDKIKEATEKLFGWLTPYVTAVWDSLKAATKAVMDFIVKVVKVAWDLIKLWFRLTPIGLVIAHWDTLKAATAAVFAWVVDKVKWAWDWLKTLFRYTPVGLVITNLDKLRDAFSSAFDWIVDKAQWLWDQLSAIFDRISGAFDSVKGVVDKVNPFSSGAASGGSAGVATVTPLAGALVNGVASSTPGTYAVSRAGASAPVTVNVYGALDADGVARQIRKLLANHDARQGRMVGASNAVAW
jgi:hypothetical protein